jgi:hypothetical protein
MSFKFPRHFGERLGLVLGGLDGLNEIGAQYGGFFLAAALVNGLALLGVLPRQASFIVNAVVFGGLITGRFARFAIDGSMNGYGGTVRALFIIDALGFALSIVASFLAND